MDTQTIIVVTGVVAAVLGALAAAAPRPQPKPVRVRARRPRG